MFDWRFYTTSLLILGIVLAFLFGSANAQEVNSASGAQAVAIVGGGSSGRSQRIHTTPDAIAPGIIPSHPCAVTYSGGVSITGFGASIGGAIVDEVCQAANFAGMMAQIGRHDLADEAAELGIAALRKSLSNRETEQPKGNAFQQGDFPK